MEQWKDILLSGAAVVLGLLILTALVRAVLGPRFTDRIVAVNAINSLVVAELALLSVRLHADFLIDVALIYGLISFLAVTVAAQLVQERKKKKVGGERRA